MRLLTHAFTSLYNGSSFLSVVRVLWDRFDFVAAAMTTVISCVVQVQTHSTTNCHICIMYIRISYVMFVQPAVVHVLRTSTT